MEQATLLLVDDIPENLDTLVKALETAGFRLVVAQNGSEVFKRLAQIHPDLILLDVLMPEMDGFEVCRRLKAQDATRDIPVLFMSALAETIDKVKGFAVGAADYITKPFQHDEVLARVNTHLTIRKLHQELAARNQALQAALDREHVLRARAQQMLDDLRVNLSKSLPHELRTPLNSMLGYAQQIKNLQQLPALGEIQEYGRMIYQSGQRLHRIVENTVLYADLKLLKYAEQPRSAPSDAPISDVREVLTDVFSQCAHAAGRPYDGHLHLTATHIRIDITHLRKVLTEVLTNAFTFSNPGTPVELATLTTGEQWILTVTDHGCGMTDTQLAEIGAFVQFERQQYEQQGLGLGLTVALLLTQFDGGTLTIESAVQQGTTVRLMFAWDAECAAADRHAAQTSRIAQDNATAPELILPPASILVMLDEFARIGDISALEETVAPLAANDDRLAPFVAMLKEMIRQFRLKPIRELLARYLAQSQTPAAAAPVLPPSGGCDNVAAPAVGAAPQPGKPSALDAVALATLPAELRDSLRQAVNIVDVDLVLTQIARIRPYNLPLAEALLELVANYRFDTLLALFQQLEK